MIQDIGIHLVLLLSRRVHIALSLPPEGGREYWRYFFGLGV
jgi:hypothetical protein